MMNAVAEAETSEWLDIFDDNFRLVGSKSRRAVHVDGNWHQTFDCWIVRRVPEPAVLFQHRSLDKLDHPGLWDASIGGHIRTGETVLDGAREAREELGLDLTADILVPLGLRTCTSRTATRIDREFQHIFLAQLDLALDAFRLNPEEVSALAWLGIEQGMDLVQGRARQASMEIRRWSGEEQFDTMESSDLVPCKDRYYQRVFIAASRYLAGSCDLAI